MLSGSEFYYGWLTGVEDDLLVGSELLSNGLPEGLEIGG
jgi:hypothetical protein